jgi:hypothetical protein
MRCAECGREAPPGAAAWEAELGNDLRDDDPPEAGCLARSAGSASSVLLEGCLCVST